MMNGWSIHFDPLLPGLYLAAITGACVMVIIMAMLGSKRGIFLRLLTVAVFLLVLFNPALLREERKPVKDVAVILVDESPSQAFGKRQQRTDQMLAHLQNKLQNRDDIELRVIRNNENGILSRETKLFAPLDQALSDVPAARRAGVLVLSDGQIHDVPQNPDIMKQYGPVNLLLSGDKNEIDRQIIILEAPTYGITGQSITARFKIEDTNANSKTATVTLNGFDKQGQSFTIETGKEQVIDLPVENAGQNIFELSVQGLDSEITLSNNKAVFIVNGVRDRLKVLLVSGRPYTGGRTWRDMLKSDPGVDLVHFTILREPEKIDLTPQHEMSLIPFPFRELFEIKLYDFDLIVFDRYSLNRILPDYYFENIVRYVREGGALLVASGPEYSGKESLYDTPLGAILPAAPMGDVLKEKFKPALNENGKKHPVTEDLQNVDWGSWLRQVGFDVRSGDVLMTGTQDKPLLVLDRVDEGRVAQLASDHMWLWARGYEGGGPSTQLLRRLAHWLMKEPELDEQALNVKIDQDNITVQSRNFKNDNPQVTMIKPDGKNETLILKQGENNILEISLKADQLGVYAFENAAGQKRFAVVGDINPPELTAVIATDKKLKPMMNMSGGGALWMKDNPSPDIRFLTNARNYAGNGWIGLRKNNDYTVTGVHSTPLLSKWVSALLLISLLTLTWWREGR